MPVNGRSTLFQYDNQTGLGLLREHFNGPLSFQQQHWTISNLVISPGKWNYEALKDILRNDILRTINAIYINNEKEGKDELIQSWPKDGNFDSTSTYEFIDKFISWENTSPTQNFYQIWKLPVPLKNQTLIQLITQGSIKTKYMLKRRGICGYHLFFVSKRRKGPNSFV